MPKKKKAVAGPSGGQAWTPAELSTLRRKFSNNTNRDLAEMLGRGIKSIIWQAANLGLTKSQEHRAANSRRTALATLTPEHMRTIGSSGGKIGGKARAESLTSTVRKKIAKAAITARWAQRDSNINPIFSLTNELTGWAVYVFDRGDCFTVEQYDVDGAYMGSRTFVSDTKAIAHAVLLS